MSLVIIIISAGLLRRQNKKPSLEIKNQATFAGCLFFFGLEGGLNSGRLFMAKLYLRHIRAPNAERPRAIGQIKTATSE